MRQVYRGAESYLITLSNDEAPCIQDKIEKGDVSGLKGCIVATSEDYTFLLNDLKQIEFKIVEKIMPLVGTLIAK